MRRFIPSRRLIALLAVYVIALQALLLPLTVVAHPFGSESLCSSATQDGGPGSTGHDTGCACAAGCGMLCHAQGLTDTPPVAAAARTAFIGKIAPVRPVIAVVRASGRTPLMARAPPAV